MSQMPPSPTSRTKLRRWALVLGLSVAALLAGVVGWGMLRDGVRQWFSRQQHVGAWAFQVWGASHQGATVLSLDSLSIRGPSLQLRLRIVKLRFAWTSVSYPVPATLSIQARRLDLLPVSTKDTSAIAFPNMGLPLSLQVELDSLVVHASSLDTGRTLVAVQGIRLESQSPRRAIATVREASSPEVSAQAKASLSADWTESDTLRLRLSVVAASGCCASDTLEGDASLFLSALHLGRVRVRGRIAESREWSAALPGLAKAPAIHGIELDLATSANRSGRNLHAMVGFSADSLVVLPPMGWRIGADLTGRVAKLRVEGTLPGSKISNLDLSLNGSLPASNAIAATEATGRATVHGLGMLINGFNHPFDSDVKIQSLNRKGARVELVTAAGSDIRGQVRWKGFHWTLDGDIVPEEPWAVSYADSLHLDGGGRAHGQDSAGTALFDVVARHPRIRMVRLDSLSTHVRISLPGPKLTFSRIEANDSTHLWIGRGNISIPDSLVHFELSPAWDTAGRAQLNVKIGGPVLIQARDFPSLGLPLRLAGLPAFPLRLDADFRRDPPKVGVPAVSTIGAAARGKPDRDSVHASLEMVLGDSSIRIGNMQVSVGESTLEGGLVLGLAKTAWILDTLRVSTDRFDLSRLHGLVPGLPGLRGSLSGHILSQRGQGVSADLRLVEPAIVKPEGDVLLPDLVLWGERDTLHLGGWWPLGGARAPFRLTATHLWDPSPEFSLLAFWGDVVRVRAQGVFQDKRHLHTDVEVDGSVAIPGTEARLRDLEVKGAFEGDVGEKGFSWKATADGTQGELQALAGNPLELRFHADADPAEIRLLEATLGGTENGTLRAKGRYDLVKHQYSLAGHASALHFDLGSGKSIALDSLVVTATPDSRILLDVQGASWHQAWNRSERLDVRVPTASLVFAQARDWRKLSGDVTVDKVVFTRNFADPKALWYAARQAFSSRRKSSVASGASIPTLLDLRISSEGDSIRLSDNLGQARLGFDLQVAGPSEAPLLNGFMAADTDGGHFGYLRRDFHIDTLRVDWNTEPIAQGQFQLAGFRNIRRNCQEQSSMPSTSTLVVDSCRLAISAQGTLEDPRLRAITSDCATQPGDDGTVGATIALATGCYPQQSGNSRFGSTLESAGTDFLVDWGKDQVNELVANGLRDSRRRLVWIPDSVALTDVPNPTSTTRDQLGLMALYHINQDFDFAGIYQHTFTTSTLGAKPVLTDNYGLSLRYHIPFGWIEDTATRQRLEHRVFLQCDVGEALDADYQRQWVYQPSLRYRWEFW